MGRPIKAYKRTGPSRSLNGPFNDQSFFYPTWHTSLYIPIKLITNALYIIIIIIHSFYENLFRFKMGQKRVVSTRLVYLYKRPNPTQLVNKLIITQLG